MDAETWRANNDNPAWVRNNRDELAKYGFQPPTGLSRIGEWLNRKKGAVTTALKEADE